MTKLVHNEAFKEAALGSDNILGRILEGFKAFAASLLIAAIILIPFFSFTPHAHAQSVPPAFPSCTSDVYLAQNQPTQLFQVDTSTNPFTYPNIGPAHSSTYNAIGFNPADNFIYGVDRPSGSYIRLLRIGSNGAVQVLGTITGGSINVPNGMPVAGEIGADGFYYLKFQLASDQAIYRVNLATRVATRINLSQPRTSVDLAWYNGRLYSHDAGIDVFYSIDPSNGQVQDIGPTGTTAQFGAMVSASNGVFGINNGGGFYQFNLQTGAATLISSSPSTGNNDGAKCYSTPLQFGADLAITKTDGTNFYTAGSSTTYDIVVSNSGPFGVQGVVVDDPLPAGISSASWTCGGATGGGACGQANGSGAISGRTVDLPAGASVTFTMTLQIPPGYSGDLINTATVTPPDTALDTDLSNNSATDVDAGIEVAKSLVAESGALANLAEPGEQLTYQITLTNTGTVAVSDYDLIDTLDANSSFVSATGGGTLNGSNVEWTNLSIPAGGSLVLTVVAQVDDPLPPTLTQISNIARDPDGPVPDCPSDQCVVTPVAPVVTYSKDTTATNAAIGDVVTYMLTARVFHSPTTDVLTLTDTLGAGLDFAAVTDAGAFTCTPGSPLVCTLPAGTSVGTYSLTYTATVNASATGSVTNAVVGTGGDDPTCSGTCDTDTPVVAPDVTFAKTADTVGPVSTGDVITFTLTTTITNSLITSDVVLLTDTLGSGLDFNTVTDAGLYGVDASGDPVIEFTLPAGTGPGSYAVSYTAIVAPDATGSVSNVVVGSGPDNPTCTTACGTETQVADTSVAYSKSVSAPAATVAVGDELTYTLSVTVANSPTTDIVTLTDTLGTGLDFTAITDAGIFTCTPSNPFSCTLAAGTPVGTYDITYTATVNDDATGSVTNAVLGSGPDSPVCGGSCDTTTNVTPSRITYAKSTSATNVSVGDTISYTLSATVTNSQTTGIFTLTDTLGAGLDFSSVTSAGAFTCVPGNPLSCTLPAGTPVGSYSLTYNAIVNTSATGSVTNAVIGTGSDDPTCSGTCDTETTVDEPAVSYAKFADTAGPVSVGDVITFTLRTIVANSMTTSDLVLLTDTLGSGLEFTAVTDAGAYGVDASGAPVVEFTLPAGTGPGTYEAVYTATVTADASAAVTNAVVGTGGDNPTCTVNCGTETTVQDPTVTYAKSTSATEARVGDVIEYTLTAIVANAATNDILTLTDTMGAGLDFTAVTDAGAFTCNAANPLVCTLPTGTAAGTYSLTYTATVNAAANGSITNAVLGTGGDDPACSGACDTDTPVVAPGVTYAKTADATGPVSAGDIITYTLSTIVANSQTTGDVVLTDTLGAGLDFTAVTDAGTYGVDASGAPILSFTLPAGTAPGTYEVTYTATVNGQASGSVSNGVVGSGDDDPTCSVNCGTITTVDDPTVTYAKSADAAQVGVGDVITYTLTANVANAATSNALTLTDTLGAGLDFAAVTDAGAFTCTPGSPLVCTLPAGTAVGTYSLTYTATVNSSATGSVANAVVGTGGDDPACSGACEIDTPVIAPDVTFAKAADTAGPVSTGDVITFTLTTTITNSLITSDVVLLTDTLGSGLDFNAVTDTGLYGVDASGDPVIEFTLPAGTGPGSYAVSYTATVNASATGSVSNVVVGSGADNPICTVNCGTETTVEDSAVTYGKSVIAASPTVSAGDVLSYELTVTVANSPTTDAVTLTDTLGAGLDFGSVTDAGIFTCTPGSPLVCTLPAGTPVGSYSLAYDATVNVSASGSVTNAVLATGGDDPACAGSCTTDTPMEDPAVTYAKSSSATQVQVGDVINYTLTATVANSATTGLLTLTDTMGAGLDFTAVTDAGAFTCTPGNPLVCTLPAGTAVGTYSLTYTATVNASATGNVTNAVLGSGPDAPACGADCAIDTPVIAPAVSYAKTASTAGPVSVGDEIGFTLTTTIANSMTTSDVVLLTDTLGSGLDFTAVTDAGAYGVDASGAPVVRFTLPAGTGPGTYAVSYIATVNDAASGSVSNVVVGTGGDNPTCTTSCGTQTTVEPSAVTYGKSANAAQVKVGDVLSYTLTATVANSATTGTFTLTDTLGTGLDFAAVTDAGIFSCTPGNPLVCTLPAGTAPGTYSLTYTASVNASATGSVTNAVLGSGAGNPTCSGACNTDTPVIAPDVTFAKAADTAGPVSTGDVIGFTLTTTIANSMTTSDVVLLTDTLGAGLDFTAVTDAGAYGVDASGAPVVRFTLPAGTGPGTYAVSYTATVNAAASGSVSNVVVGTGGDNPTCTTNCGTQTTVEPSAVTYSKSSIAAQVRVGDTITYSLTATVANSATTDDLTLTDTLGTGLDFVAVTDAGAFTCAPGNPLVCTLPTGTAVGTYSLSYTATVNSSATGSVSNVVVGSGDDNPVCAGSCRTDTTVEAPGVTYSKSVNAPADRVRAGDILDYTLVIAVTNAPTTDILTLTDTPGNGLDFTAITDAGAFTCTPGNPLVCTLPAGTAPGTYSLAYRATVNAAANGSVTNAVMATGGDDPACAGNCATENLVAAPVISIAKSSDPAAGETVQVGQTVNYALVATIANGAIAEPLVLVDTPDPGLTITNIPAGCEMTGGTITCTLPAGTPAGTHSLAYGATINDGAGEAVRNVVTASGGGGTAAPSCDACATEHKVALPLIRLAKAAAVREVRIGDLVRYTLSVENVGERDLIGGNIMDMPPAGFTYVEGSLQVVDGDNAATLSGQGPLRFGEVDVRAGETATLVYLMRVGAGVRPGTHINQAHVYSIENVSVSNPATARVELVGDPLVDDTLIFGTVFDDRDGDGWQDSAALSGLHVQGGFAPEAYVPGSTMIDRGQGMMAQPDASAPLLHGIDLGGIAARQSEADPAGKHRIVIRQRLTDPAFTDDFVLTSAQGVTIRMDAAGRTSVEKGGDAAKGLNGAEPRIERRIAQGEGGYVVDYVIENDGIDERGIPGVRIASVEGLVMETDQFGRYHLEAVPGGAWERGRNFILKVDPSTLPDGAAFTTDNPLLRRITPGIPVRFDWGVKLPPALVEGRTETVELELGQVIFAPASAEIREDYLSVIDRMAAEISEYQGGEVVLEASGENASLAFDRAEAVKTLLLHKLDTASARNLTITARGRVDDPSSLVVGVDEGGALLGTVLFDTDSAEIRPEFAPLLGQVAAWLAREGGGAVAIIGHTDMRGSYEYNTALGMRRARAVYDALASQLSPDIRAKVRVDSSNEPTAPVDEQSK